MEGQGMTKQEILDFLGTFVRQQKSEVNYGTYRSTQRKSLLNDGLSTRANSVWKQSQFVVAYMDKTETEPVDSFLNGWSQLTRGIYDQYLILEAPEGVWTVYDKNCENKGNVEFLKTVPQCEAKFGTRNNITQKKLLEEDLTKKLSYLSALRTKPFMLLAGISGTGKSRIVRKLAQATVSKEIQQKYNEKFTSENFDEEKWELHRPENFELIQVKPNWHNSMDVIGYLSNMNGAHYEFTPFVKFIVKAWCNPTIPFFLCLDEMNLAPVEEYFAEFLSAIESRGFDKGEYMTDPIIKPFDEFGNGVSVSMINSLNDSLKEAMGSDVENHLRTKGLTLPPNLIVIGTVNMDETTFSFSRKVLDRAMSIEMNEVNYDSFLNDATDDELKAIVEEFGEELNKLLVNRYIHAKEVVVDLDKATDVIKYLQTINNLLEGTPFKLGYRAANEALIYLQSTIDFGMDNFAQAMDNFTLMKILSRIEGDESKLRITESNADNERLAKAGLNRSDLGDNPTILQALRAIIVNQLSESPTTEDGEETKSVELKSIKKIDQMISQLNRDHFVSYWN